MSRHLAREKALQALFAVDVGGSSLVGAEELALDQQSLEPADGEFFHSLLTGVTNRLPELDRYINDYAVGWSLDRLANVDRNVLRLALFEMLYLKDIPHTVSINEAVELAKVYNTEEAGKFVNGLLDTVRKFLESSIRPGGSRGDVAGEARDSGY